MRTSIVIATALALAFATSGAAADSQADCSAQAFQDNSCSVCAMQQLPSGAGDKTVSDVVFTWKNTGTMQQVIYDAEQTKPQLVLVGSGSSFSMEPSDASKFWAWSPSLSWVTYPDSKEYILDAGKQVDTHVSASGSVYVIKTGAMAEGSPVALVKSTIVYHDIDANFDEGAKKEYTACTLYTNAAPAAVDAAVAVPEEVAAPAPVKPTASSEAKTKITSKMTKVATGPAENVLAAAALLIAAVLAVALRRKSRA